MSAVSPSAPQSKTAMAPMPRRLTSLTVVTGVSLLWGLALAVVLVGPDSTQGDVQRLFYIHMPSFFGAFFAFAAAVIGGLGYLRTRNIKWDLLAASGV